MFIAALALLNPSRYAPTARMSASEWLGAEHKTLPLIHLPMEVRGIILPGESRRLVIDKADDLAALEAAEHGCVGALITTPHQNALATSTLLEVREVRKQEVGATIEVVAAGRIHIGSIDHDRCFTAHSVNPAFDSRPESDAGMGQIVDDLRKAAEQHENMRRKLGRKAIPAGVKIPGMNGELRGKVVPTGRVSLDARSAERTPLDEACAQMREELCVVHLDEAPAASLERLYELWDVPHEEAAELQVLSFAACTSLTAMQRSLALGMEDTAERLQYARRCLLKAANRMAAKTAIRDALGAH